MVKFALSLTSAALVAGSDAGATSAIEMMGYCLSNLEMNAGVDVPPVEVARAAKCTGLAIGVSTMLSFNCWSINQGYTPMFAASAPEKLGDVITYFVHYVNSNPDSHGEDAVEVMIGSMMTHLPCEE